MNTTTTNDLHDQNTILNEDQSLLSKFVDTHTRTLVKVFSYRCTVGITAFITSIVLGHGAGFGLSYIVLSFTLGYFTFWIQERLWNYFKWGKVKDYDKHKRTIAKTVTWRLFSLVVLYIYGLVMGLSSESSLTWTIIVNINFIIVHYLHERVWNWIKWGKVEKIEEQVSQS